MKTREQLQVIHQPNTRFKDISSVVLSKLRPSFSGCVFPISQASTTQLILCGSWHLSPITNSNRKHMSQGFWLHVTCSRGTVSDQCCQSFSVIKGRHAFKTGWMMCDPLHPGQTGNCFGRGCKRIRARLLDLLNTQAISGQSSGPR